MVHGQMHRVPGQIGMRFRGLMFIPHIRPAFRRHWIKLTEQIRLLEHGIDQFQHGRGRPPGHVHGLHRKLSAGAMPVMLLHPPEQPRITTAPAVDGLFHIAHAEKGTVRILHRFIHQILHHTPLRGAGILKFIQQPMIKRAVEPVFQRQPIRPYPAQHRPASFWSQ